MNRYYVKDCKLVKRKIPLYELKSDGYTIEYNFIKQDGTYLFNTWFYLAERFFRYKTDSIEKSYSKVLTKSLEWNYIDLQGNFISNSSFHYVSDFYNGYASVSVQDNKNYLMNYIDLNGKFLSKIWFKHVGKFYKFCGCVRLNEKCNYIKSDGTFLFDEWLDGGLLMKTDFALIKKKSSTWKLVDNNGNYIYNKEFKDYTVYESSEFIYGEVTDMNNDSFLIDMKCNLIPYIERDI